MFTFKQFLFEETSFLVEAKSTSWGLNTSDAGKFHEVLTGGLINHYASVYQANKSKGHKEAHERALNAILQPPTVENKKKVKVAKIHHMEQFRDESANKSAAEWHDHLSSKLNQNDYNEHLAHATHAASNIINHLHEQGITDIKKTHFTANEKDIEKLTNGKDSSKKGNNSDIVIEHGHKEKGGGFHGVSLKSGGSSKLFNPGMGGVTRLIDDAHKELFGKSGSMTKDVQAADAAAMQEHHKILSSNVGLLSGHFGKDHVKHDKKAGTVNISNDAMDTIRYAHEHVSGIKDRSKELKGIDQNKVKKLGSVYSQLLESRLTSYKRPAAKSFNQHLNKILSAKGAAAKKVQARVISALTNTPEREESNMKIMRHNVEFKKGQRKGKIAYGIGDAASTSSRFEVKNSGGIGNDIVGKDKNGKETMRLSVVADASPSAGSGSGSRKGFHVWDKTKK